MATDIQQAIQEKVAKLPPEKQREVLDFVENLEKPGEVSEAAPLKTIWEKIEGRMKQVPQEAWEDLPADGSTNVDHYLYGAPKK